MSLYGRILRYFKPFFAPTLGSILLMSLGIGFNLLKPWPFKFIVDGILDPSHQANNQAARLFLAHWLQGASPLLQIVLLSMSLILITLLANAFSLLNNSILIKVGLRALLKLRTELYSCLQSLPLRFHDNRHSTDSSYRVAYDAQAIQTIYNQGFSTTFNAVGMLLGTFIVMWQMDHLLTAISILVLPLIFWAMRYYGAKIRRESISIHERESQLLTTTQERLSSIRMIQSFVREKSEVSFFFEQAQKSLRANFKMNMTSTKSALVITTLMALGTALMYAFGAIQVLQKEISLGELLVFASYLTMLYQPLEQLTSTAWAVEGAAAGAKRCFDILDLKEETEDLPSAKTLSQTKGTLQFENVCFAYHPAKPILKKISLEIPSGSSIAFVGGTGTGKSTLLSLIPRFYDPQEGSICLDGHDLRDFTKRSLRQQIGIVFQETLLFSTTIEENIAYGAQGASQEAIIEAAKKAQAYDFIMKMPQGFQTPVGERGGHLSVGQRQRIGIARAFLKDAPILLLDEPTSALDPQTEQEIMQTIFELMQGRTTLIVTHRIATIHQLDHIALLKEGALVEEGSGSDLLARNGLYAQLYKAGIGSAMGAARKRS